MRSQTDLHVGARSRKGAVGSLGTHGAHSQRQTVHRRERQAERRRPVTPAMQSQLGRVAVWIVARSASSAASGVAGPAGGGDDERRWHSCEQVGESWGSARCAGSRSPPPDRRRCIWPPRAKASRDVWRQGAGGSREPHCRCAAGGAQFLRPAACAEYLHESSKGAGC